jgi:NADH-quinone oxidoreductase subunit L
MTIPLIILAILSTIGGFLGIPLILGGWFSPNPSFIENWLDPVFADASEIIRLNSPQGHTLPGIEFMMMAISVLIAIGGIMLARRYYSDPSWSTPRKLSANFKFFYKLSFNKYKLDEFYYGAVVDPVVYGSRGFLWRFFDTMIIDGLVNGTAKFTLRSGSYVRMIQSGIVQNYALFMLGGIIVIIAWIVLSL